MKSYRKLLSAVLVITLVFALFGGAITAYADDNEVKLTTSRSGNIITVDVVATKELTFGGLSVVASTDGKSTYVSASSSIGSVLKNLEEGTAVADTGETVTIAEGGVVLSLGFEVADGFEVGTEYTFSVLFDELYDSSIKSYTVAGQTLTTTYKEEATTYTVTFDADGGTPEPEAQTVNDGATATKPEDPSKDGYTFKYWTLNGAEYDFDTPVTSNITLVAKYTKDATEPGEIDLSKIEITKTVSGANGVKIPAETFTFTFTPTTEDPVSPDKAPLDTPAIPSITISFAGGSGTTLKEALGVVTFPAAGTYAYTVKETVGSAEGWTYDDTEYTLYITIEDEDGALKLGSFVIVEGDDEEKADGLDFENTYATTTKLTISKEVKALKTTDKFKFHITFDTSFTGTVDGEEVEFKAGEAYDFELADGEELVIDGIPAGAKYTLVEDGTELFTPSAVVVENGVEGDEVTGEYGKELKLENKLVGNEGDNKVDVTNTYSITPPTGVIIHSDMLVIACLVLLALIGGFVLNRKLRSANE